MAAESRSEVAAQLDLQQLRYSMVWEDERILVEGLEIEPGDVVLSIASAGDNAFACLLAGAARVIAIDMSPAQIALLRLKLAALEHLEHRDFAALLAVVPDAEPLLVYERLRPKLEPELRSFWDASRALLERGISRCGRLERYFGAFREGVLVPAWGPELIRELLDAKDVDAQAALYAERIHRPEVEATTRSYFGLENMAKEGRSAAQSAYVEAKDVGAYWYERFRDVCTRVPISDNFYLERFLTGGTRDLENGPSYLRPSRYDELRSRARDIVVMQDELERLLASPELPRFDKANLSDIFEYMSQEAADRLFAALARRCREKGRLAYWNLLIPRTPGPALLEVLDAETERATELWRRDRCWFYRSFHIDVVRA